MYQVTIKGKTLEELKSAVKDIADELCSKVLVSGMEKSLEDELGPVDLTNVEPDVLTPPLDIVPTLQAPVPEGIDFAKRMNNNADLDVEGIPWDKRIHTIAQTKTKAKIWKLKRGVEDKLVADVKTELLLNVQALANPTPVPPAPINESTPIVPVPGPVVDLPGIVPPNVL